MSRRKGLHARLGLQLVHHQGTSAAGEEAFGLYAWMLMWSRLNELDGFVPARDAERGISGDRRRNLARLKLLMDPRVGFVSKASHPVLGDGYEVLRFSEFNETKTDIDVRRGFDRERKRDVANDFRPETVPESERKGGWNPAGFPDSDSDSDSDPERKREPERLAGPPATEPLPPPPEAPPADWRPANIGTAMASELELAYARGISSVTNAPYALPDRFKVGDLLRVVNVHAPAGASRREAIAWIEETAKRYAFAKRDDPKAELGYRPSKFNDWLNGGNAAAKRSSHSRQLAAGSPAPAERTMTEAELQSAADQLLESLKTIGVYHG